MSEFVNCNPHSALSGVLFVYIYASVRSKFMNSERMRALFLVGYPSSVATVVDVVNVCCRTLHCSNKHSEHDDRRYNQGNLLSNIICFGQTGLWVKRYHAVYGPRTSCSLITSVQMYSQGQKRSIADAEARITVFITHLLNIWRIQKTIVQFSWFAEVKLLHLRSYGAI